MLRTDLYTKLILTVIAVCLVVLCLEPMHAPVPVFAQTVGGTQRVVIAGFDAQALHEGVPVWIAGGKGSVPVSIAGGTGPVPVNITTVGGKAGAPLPVSIAK
jgi:NaMN:DMB phosphoribosyltransferase